MIKKRNASMAGAARSRLFRPSLRPIKISSALLAGFIFLLPVLFQSQGLSGTQLTASASNAGSKVSGSNPQQKEGSLSIAGVTFVEQPYPPDSPVHESTADDDPASTNDAPSFVTTDGNPVTLIVTFTNGTDEDFDGVIVFLDDETGDYLPKPDGTDNLPIPLYVPAGQFREVRTEWDTNGFSWDDTEDPTEPAQPHPIRRIRFSVRDASGEVIYALDEVKITPKPVILVHGWASDSDTWNAYGNYLSSTHPDWYGYAVTGMDTKFTPTNNIDENAVILGEYIEAVRNDTGACHVDIVGHSMGGLISRAYIQNHMPRLFNGYIRPAVSHFLMLGTPNLGSPCAYLQYAVAPALRYTIIPQPATSELLPSYLTDFNKRVRDSRDVPFYALAGNPKEYTCYVFSGVGDGFVEVSSVYANVVPAQTQTPTFSHHLQMTSSLHDFHAFVEARLALGPNEVRLEEHQTRKPRSAEDEAKTESSQPARPQIVLSESREIAAGASVDIVIPVPQGSAFGILLPTLNSIGATLYNPSGTAVDTIPAGSQRALEIVSTFRVANHATGNWKLRLENTGTADATTGAAVWIEGSPINLDIPTLSIGANRRVQINATFTNNGAPITGGQVTADLSEANGTNLSVVLLDDGQHADGGAGDGNYGGAVTLPTRELYGVVVRAEAAGVRRMTTDAVDAVIHPTLFSDVQPNDYFFQAVEYLARRYIVSGYSDGTFRPYNNATRGQLTKIVVAAQGWAIDTTGGPHFVDVQPDNPFYTFVETAYHHNVIGGYADGTFRVGNNVTRGQLCKIIVAAQGWAIDTTGGPHFVDVQPDNPFYTFVETAYHHNVIGGYADGTFRVGNNATRGQIAKIVYGTLDD
jgi:pimeloyl-ACP methyl ester carboxylesterase